MKTITNLNINSLKVRTIGELANSNFNDSKNLTIKLDKELHRKLKILAVSADTTMSEIIRSFLVQFVEQYRKENVIEDSKDDQD